MAVKNPKAKGNNFERTVAKLFSDWSGVKFMRTPMSGAIHNFKDRRVVSDIVPPLTLGNFPFSIECKKVTCSWEFSVMLEKKSMTLGSHWDQCRFDAEREALVPFLVFTKNYRAIYVVLRKQDYQKLNLQISHIKVYAEDKIPVVIFSLTDFFDNITCADLLKIEF